MGTDLGELPLKLQWFEKQEQLKTISKAIASQPKMSLNFPSIAQRGLKLEWLRLTCVPWSEFPTVPQFQTLWGRRDVSPLL